MAGTTVFVSYTGVDQAWAEWIAWHLEQGGFTVVLQAWDMPAGSNFVVEMQTSVVEADRTILVFSAAALRSRFVAAEWAAAFAQSQLAAEYAYRRAPRDLLTLALAESRSVLAPEHPDVPKRLYNLALTEAELGERGAAQAHFEEALAIFTAAFGEDHAFAQ